MLCAFMLDLDGLLEDDPPLIEFFYHNSYHSIIWMV